MQTTDPTPTFALSWKTILSETIGAFLAGKMSFVVGDVAVTIAGVSGEPVKFSLATAIFAAENVFLGSTGQLQLGNVLVTIGRQAPSGSSATEASAAIASAIAANITPSGPAIAGDLPVVATGAQSSATVPPPAGYAVHTFGHTAP